MPRTEPGIWFHELPPLATIHGAIVVTDAGATPAGSAMALAHESAPRECCTQVASGVGTSQEGEAMTLLLCIRRLAQQEGMCWVVPNFESTVGALCTYHEGGHCRDDIHQ